MIYFGYKPNFHFSQLLRGDKRSYKKRKEKKRKEKKGEKNEEILRRGYGIGVKVSVCAL